MDEVDSKELRKPFTDLFAVAQRFKVLEQFEFLDGKYLLSADGSGYFLSDKVHCEPLHKQDSKSIKSDSESLGMKRFLNDFRREHPKLAVILLDYEEVTEWKTKKGELKVERKKFTWVAEQFQNRSALHIL